MKAAFESAFNECFENVEILSANAPRGKKDLKDIREACKLNTLALDYLTNFKMVFAQSFPYDVAQSSRTGPRSAKVPLREIYSFGAIFSYS